MGWRDWVFDEDKAIERGNRAANTLEKYLSKEKKQEAERCEVTTNPCGSDTWAEGYSCECSSCQAWLKTRQSTFKF